MLLSYFSYRCAVTGGMADMCPENAGKVTFVNPIPGKPAAFVIQLTDPERNHIKQQQLLTR
jgi:hypothetical protein